MENDKKPTTIQYDNNDFSYKIAIIYIYKVVLETTGRAGSTAGTRDTTTVRHKL